MISTRQTPSARRPDLSADAAYQALDAMRVVDVRQPDEFNGDLGHIESAELVPLADLGAALRSWPLEAPLLIVCRSGRRAAAACDLLVEAGFKDVQNLGGGMLAWAAAGLPARVDQNEKPCGLGGQR